MSYKTTLTLLVVVCGLGLAVWVLQHNVEPTESRLAREQRVLDIDLLHLNGLVIQHGDTEMRLEKRSDGWWIVQPIEARADEGAVSRIVTSVESLECIETVTREQRRHRALSLGDYGLDVSRSAITFYTPLGVRRLLMGHTARLGGATYVRIDGKPDVLVAQGDCQAALTASLESMRDHALWSGQSTRVSRLELERSQGGFVQLLRRASGWTMQQPRREPAESSVVESLLDLLFAARIDAFVWDPPVDDSTAAAEALSVVDAPTAPIESYGLAPDTAAARIRIWYTGDDVGRELILGKPVDGAEDTVYAMFKDDRSIFTLSAALLEASLLPVERLRSHRLVQLNPQQIRYVALQQGDQKLALGYTPDVGWSVLDPIQWPADQQTVRDVLSTLTGARIQSFIDDTSTNSVVHPGDDFEALHITLDTVYPPPDQRLSRGGSSSEPQSADLIDGRCEMSAQERREDDLMVVAVSGRVGQFLVRRDALVLSQEATTLPLMFLDRTMLALSPESVQRLTVHRGDTVQSVQRTAEKGWSVVDVDGNADAIQGAPDALVVSDLLFLLSNLRAVRVAAQQPGDVTLYGLGESAESLTIGLTGSDAILKTIVLGSQAKPSGRYAMVQGQDVVFVLDVAVADALLRDLVVVVRDAGNEP